MPDPTPEATYAELKRQDPARVLLFGEGDEFVALLADRVPVRDALEETTIPHVRTFDRTTFHRRDLDHVLSRLVERGHVAAVCERVKAAPKDAAVERCVLPGE